MTRWCKAALLVVVMWGAARAEDVTYLDRKAKKEVDVTGTITEEGPGGIKIKVRVGKDTETRSIAADDIVKVVDKLSFKTPLGKEAAGRLSTTAKDRSKYFQQALDGYTALEGKMTDMPAAQRFLQYKIAKVTLLMAQDDPEDEKKMQQAIKL